LVGTDTVKTETVLYLFRKSRKEVVIEILQLIDCAQK